MNVWSISSWNTKRITKNSRYYLTIKKIFSFCRSNYQTIRPNVWTEPQHTSGIIKINNNVFVNDCNATKPVIDKDVLFIILPHKGGSMNEK